MTGPNHTDFLAHLERGRRVELQVACAFLDAGLAVRMEPLIKAATPYEGENFRDQEDLIVEDIYRIEVKSSTYEFTSPTDWPFPFVYACTQRRWQARSEKPVAFVILSQPTGAMLALTTLNSGDWWTRESRDSRRNGWATDTLCASPNDLLPFKALVDWMLSRQAVAA